MCGLIFVSAAIVHIVCINIIGWGKSADFAHHYHLIAVQVIEWMNGSGQFPAFVTSTGSGQFHQLFVVFVTFVYLVAGIGNKVAIIYSQVFLNALIFPLIFHMSLKIYSNRIVACIVPVISFVFFDNIGWSIYITPETLYRTLFIFSFYYLLCLFYAERYLVFLPASAILCIILSHIRPDAIIQCGPFYILMLFASFKLIKAIKISYRLMLLAVFFICILCFHGLIFDFLNRVFNLFLIFYRDGMVVGFYEYVFYDPTLSDSMTYHIIRFAKLFAFRAYHLINVFPTYWGSGHKIYYAIHMIPIYTFAVFGYAIAIKNRSMFVVHSMHVFLFTLILFGFTFATADLRISYTSLPFIIICAGYGFDQILEKYFVHQKTKHAQI